MIARRRRSKKRPTRGLMLTSLVDILTILLIFLLKSFSTEGAVLCAAQDIELPSSTSTEGVSEGDLAIALTDEGVTVAEEQVLDRSELTEGEGLLLPRLAGALGDASGGDPTGKRILIEGDKSVPFGVLYRVLFTCHQSGYPDLALAAIEKEPAAGGTP